MTSFRDLKWHCFLYSLCIVLNSNAQIDPYERRLIHLGFDQSLINDGPVGAYAFYYWNQPSYKRPDQTLRLVVAPTYLDSELGFKDRLGKNTDIAVGVAGGGFASSHVEIRGGDYIREESFVGHGGGASLSTYHLFNPGHLIPLQGVLRGSFHFTAFDETDDTARNFELPNDQGFFFIKTGLRFGGREPILLPELALEISAWYEGEFREESGKYGFGADRILESSSHKFWMKSQLNLKMDNTGHHVSVMLNAGSALDADRFSAFEIGGFLPFSAEFPLMLPGYFQKELIVENMGLFNAVYSIPLTRLKNWTVITILGSALVDYLPGLEQTGRWHSGVGGALVYESLNRNWKIGIGYSYGIDAIRTDGRGAHSAGLLLQYNFGDRKKTAQEIYEPGIHDRQTPFPSQEF